VDFDQALQELQQLYASSSRVPGFRRKVMVDADEFAAVLNNIRTVMPADVQEARQILLQKDSILNQAYLEAQRVKTSAEEEVATQLEAAQQEHRNKVGESEVTKSATTQAQEAMDHAMTEAEDIVQDAQRRAYRIISESEDVATSSREGADQYAREVLFSLEEQLSEILGQIRRGIDTLRPDGDPMAQDNIQIPA
jgi:vacuolar-type H+-ATPase subunit H